MHIQYSRHADDREMCTEIKNTGVAQENEIYQHLYMVERQIETCLMRSFPGQPG